MSEAQKILSMIKNVDPNDFRKMKEIDIRVHCFISGYEVIEYHDDEPTMCTHPKLGSLAVYGQFKSYTTSRDALKSIRPDGWFVNGYYILATGTNNENSEYQFILQKISKGTGTKSISKKCSTEELAELHAIIQAIEHERKQ